MSVAHASSFGNVWDVAICGKKHGGRAMVPKRKNEEEDDHAKGMGDSKKKKPKGPGIALVIAIGHKGKHDKDAMKKAWPMLKEHAGPNEVAPWLKQRQYDIQGLEEHKNVMSEQQQKDERLRNERMRRSMLAHVESQDRRKAQQRRENAQRAISRGDLSYLPDNISEILAEREQFDQEGAEQFAPPPPPKLPDYQSGFAADYDPDAKEKDAGF
jgi:hypothetical protein